MDVKYVITCDASGAQKAIQTFDAAIEGLGKNSDKTSSTGKGLMNSIFGQVTAANLATKAFSFLSGELGTVITEALEAEKVDRLLASTLRAHGESAKVMGEVYDNMAAQMQAVTGVADEEVKSMIALSYNLGVHREKIDDVVKGAIGLTTLYGGSMQSNLEAVARALQGNWRQADQLIPELKSLSDESDKLALLQQKMAEGFQASTDAMQGASGALTTAKNQWSDFKEGVGTGALTIFSALTSVGNALTGTSSLVKRLNEEHERGVKIYDELKKTHLVYADVIADDNIKEKEAEKILASVNQYFEDKKKIVKDVTDETKKLTTSTKDFTDAEKAKIKAEEEARKAIAAEIKAVDDLFGSIEAIIPELEGAADATDTIRTSTDKYTQSLIDAQEQAAQTWGDIGEIFGALTGLFSSVNSQLGDILASAAAAGQGIADAFATGSLSLTDFLSIGLAVTDMLDKAFGNMVDKINNVCVAIVTATDALRQFNIEAALAVALGIINPVAATATPEISAASGFYSPKLSQDTFVQMHKGEPAAIGQKAFDMAGGGKMVNINITISGNVTPESVSDAITTAYRNNTRGLKSLLEN